MSLTLYAFNDFLTAAENAMANGSVKFTNFKTGSAALALAQAIAGNSQSLQMLISTVYDVCRLATSSGSDVDSFVADFGLTRLPAVSSSGTMVFNRNNTTTPVLIPASALGVSGGALVQSTFTDIQFQVIPDTNNANYNPTLGGYLMGDGIGTMNITVAAVVPGLSGNILANTQMQLVSGVQGISTITVPSDFNNGENQETDAQLRTRFLNYISSLSKATTNAVSAAIQGVQPGLTFQIVEGQDFNGSTFTAGFIVVVDDGSGAISIGLQNTILAAINGVRAAGIQCKVYPPTVVVVNWTVHLTYGAGYAPAVVSANVAAAVKAKINGYGVGVNVSIVDIESVIQNTAGVAAYSGVTLNGGTADIVIAKTQLARAGTGTFS